MGRRVVRCVLCVSAPSGLGGVGGVLTLRSGRQERASLCHHYVPPRRGRLLLKSLGVAAVAGACRGLRARAGARGRSAAATGARGGVARLSADSRFGWQCELGSLPVVPRLPTPDAQWRPKSIVGKQLLPVPLSGSTLARLVASALVSRAGIMMRMRLVVRELVGHEAAVRGGRICVVVLRAPPAGFRVVRVRVVRCPRAVGIRAVVRISLSRSDRTL